LWIESLYNDGQQFPNINLTNYHLSSSPTELLNKDHDI